MILEAFRWWVDGLAASLLRLRQLVRRERRFRLEAAGGSFVLKPADRRNGGAASIELPDTLSADFLGRLRQRTRGSVVEIAVPDAAMLERRLDPLPRESKPYIDNVVRHQIEALFPWSAQDVLYNTFVKDQDDGRIAVTVRATSRSAVEAAFSIAMACEASEAVLVGAASAKHDADTAAIRLPLGGQALANTRHAQSIAQYALTALLVVGACAIGWTSFAHWSAATEVAALERAIADRRALLARASGPRDPAADAGLEAKRLQGPLAVLLLERLSELLPDDTYLTELSFEGDRLRISGVSGQASELVSLLERSGYFRNASFYAPTTRLTGGTSDRFSIETVVNLRVETKQ